jgi:hypothetical protein
MKLVTVVESSLSSPLFQLEGCWIDIPHWVFVYFASKDSPETLGIPTINNKMIIKREIAPKEVLSLMKVILQSRLLK